MTTMQATFRVVLERLASCGLLGQPPSGVIDLARQLAESRP